MNPIITDDTPTTEERREIDRIIEEMQQGMRDIPREGRVVKYLDKQFLVYPGVFLPFADSIPLVRNMMVRAGERFLDLGTGAGNIAVHAAGKGATVAAVDINPNAVRSANMNAKLHGYDKMCAMQSDMYEGLRDWDPFDVITANLPFTTSSASNLIEQATDDPDLEVHRKLFDGIERYLAPHGRMYVSNANFGTVDEMHDLADQAGFNVELMARLPMRSDPRVFYAFELRRKGNDGRV